MSVVQTAYNYLGTPYVWGGESPSGFDCSGLVQYSYSQNGISVPRTSEQQYAYTANSRIMDKSQLRPGDMVFFNTSGTASHVGIYIGNNQFIHAPRPGKVVRINNLDEKYYNDHFAGGGRVDGATSGAITAGGGTSEGDALNFFGKIVAFLACILLAVVAVVLFAKAFDIPTSTDDLIKKAVGSRSKKTTTTTTTPDTSEEITEDIPTVVGEVVEPVKDTAYMIDDKVEKVKDLVLY